MTTDVTIFDYAALPTERATEIRAVAERIHLRTAVAVIENGRDLIKVRNMPEMNGRFVAWLNAEFSMSRQTAYNMMQAAENLGDRFPNFGNVAPSILYALAAPSTPETVRDQVETRVGAGERITVAEVERLKREAKAAREAAERLEAERSELLSRVHDATSREQEARDHLRLAREQTDAETQKAADAARAAVLAEVEQARRDAVAAQAEAEKARMALEAAVRQAREDAEQAACEKADALAEEAIARRRGDLAEIERRAKAAEEKAQRHHEAEQRLAAEIERQHALLARIGSAKGEAPEQIEAAETLMAALSDAMIALHGFEHAPIPQAARRWAMAQQMWAQMADAITAFLAPRVREIRP
jgi:DNA repair exonuclease SbcCD ATPase subunit